MRCIITKCALNISTRTVVEMFKAHLVLLVMIQRRSANPYAGKIIVLVEMFKPEAHLPVVMIHRDWQDSRYKIKTKTR